MTKINLTTNASYNFKAPTIMADADKKIEVVFPTQEKAALTADEPVSVAIARAFTHLELVLEGNVTLTGVLGADLKLGDMVIISATADGDDRDLTLHSSLGGGTISIDQDATLHIPLFFNGETFTRLSTGGGADGADGADGKSAYEIWVDEGGQGDEAAFLADLKGDKGDQGDPGIGMTFEKTRTCLWSCN
jgi:hypothetical protein